MSSLTDEIAAYDRMKSGLERDFLGRWALVHELRLVETFDTFEAAADLAVTRFGRGPYLIRQIGVDSLILPAFVIYRTSAV